MDNCDFEGDIQIREDVAGVQQEEKTDKQEAETPANDAVPNLGSEVSVENVPEQTTEQGKRDDTAPQQEKQTDSLQSETHEQKQDENLRTESRESREQTESKMGPEQTATGNENSNEGQTALDKNEKGPEGEEEEKEKPLFAPNPKFNTNDEMLKQIKIYMDYLKQQEVYDTKEVLTILKNIGKMYTNKKKSTRMMISDFMVEHGFPEQVKKMTVYFNRIGIFKNDNVWFPCYYNLNTVWNYTDSSRSLSKAIADVGMIHYYILNISHQPYLDNRSSKNVAYVLKASMSTLQNIIRHCPECKPMFDDEKAVEVLAPFLHDKDDFMKCLAILNLTAVVSEDENAKMEDTGYIAFIVKAIRTSLKGSKRRYRGFTPLELTEGLARIAVSDFNKKKIVDNGALESLVQLMNSKNESEQLHAAKTVWTLCFDEYSRQKVKEEPDCVETLERLKLSESSEVKHAASGALWKLQEEEAHRQEKTLEGQKPMLDCDRHIFLSYNHEHADMIHKVKDKLKADGYKIWIDTEQMGGSTLEAMAEAVEKAAVVLVGASEKYKLSPNCRTEAEYTFQLKRPIVPLMMQRRYKPDGWLGMLMGAKMYINFDGKFEFDYAYQLLLREIIPYLTSGESTDVVEGQPAVVSQTSAPLFSAPPSETPPISRTKTYEAAKWTKEEVQEWINKCEFNKLLNTKLQDLLGAMDGKLLVAFCSIKTKAADFFYQHLCQQFQADMLQVVYLTDALDRLP